VAQFTLPADEKPAQNAINTLQSTLQQLAKAKGLLLPYIFQNDANEVQNPLTSYGIENLRKLKEASREYDPEQVFQRLQFGGFKVSGA